MIRVAALTSGHDTPSSRFRVRQHIQPLLTQGVAVREFTPAIDKYAPLPAWPRGASVRFAPHFYAWQALKLASRLPGLAASWRSDVTWLEREILPARYTIERILKGPVVFDVDDAIWLASPAARAAARAIAERADVVLAGNGYLADWFSAFAKEVRIVPTAVDTERFRPGGEAFPEERFVVGWTGSASTLSYLEAIEAPLREFLAQVPAAELLVVADRPPLLPTLPADRVRFVPWSSEVEATALQGVHAGLMPLPDTPWTRGKCSFKMLQYMACGIPVVVSPVGMNQEVLDRGEVGLTARSDADWYHALRTLAADREMARGLGRGGREVMEAHYSAQVVGRKIARVFRDIAGEG